MRITLIAVTIAFFFISEVAAREGEMHSRAAIQLAGIDAASSTAAALCSKEAGLDSRPLVPTKRVAKEIYISIARALSPQTWRKFPTIFVLDEGGKWTVGQTSAHSRKVFKDKSGSDAESITVQTGGGALEMEVQCGCSSALFEVNQIGMRWAITWSL